MKSKKFSLFIMVLLFLTLAYGNFVKAHAGEYYSGYWPNPTNFRCQVFSSAYSHYWDISHGFYAWNYTTGSNKLWMRSMEYRADDQNLNYEIRFFGVNLGPQGPWADTLNYKKVLWYFVPSWDNCEYAYSRIRLNSNRYPSLTQFTRRKVAAHEVGHSLSLKHPNHTVAAVMNQGTQPYNVPQQHDILNIQSKYGQ